MLSYSYPSLLTPSISIDADSIDYKIQSTEPGDLVRYVILNSLHPNIFYAFESS